MNIRFVPFLLLALISVSGGFSQTAPHDKALLLIRVENEGPSLTRPASVVDLSADELSALRKSLDQQLGTVFTIIPESDKRDCIELGVSIEKMESSHGVLYLASSAIAVGKGEDDLLLTHNVVIQPSLAKTSAALTFQLSTMALQAQLRNILKRNHPE